MTPEQELAELKAEINRVWYLAYPESLIVNVDSAAKMRIFNLYQDLDCTRFNFRVLSKAYNALETPKKLNEIIHYPQCWDTAAYPTVLDAVSEVFECSECAMENK